MQKANFTRSAAAKAAVGGTWQQGTNQPSLEMATCFTNTQNQPQVTPIAQAMDSVKMDTSDDHEELEEGGDVTKRKTWKRKFPFYNKESRKKKSANMKHMKVRKLVHPKCAIQCLNELIPGVMYNIEDSGGPGYCYSVTANDQKFHGMGSSKLLAKNAAAEAALVSFVQPPAEGPDEEEKTPWAVIASFALYKLFCDWKEGRVGMGAPMPHAPFSHAMPPVMGQQGMGMSTMMEQPNMPKNDQTAISAHLLSSSGQMPPPSKEKNVSASATRPQPAKQLPANASAMHPVMLLHQMKPSLEFQMTQEVRDGKSFFTVSCIVDVNEQDSQTYVGEGTSMKKAKVNLAIAVNKAVYDIETAWCSG